MILNVLKIFGGWLLMVSFFYLSLYYDSSPIDYPIHSCHFIPPIHISFNSISLFYPISSQLFIHFHSSYPIYPSSSFPCIPSHPSIFPIQSHLILPRYLILSIHSIQSIPSQFSISIYTLII